MAEAGKLVQLMRGIYVDAGDDIDATVLKHAVRIAKYRYPKAYLSAASAALLGPTLDGRLFLSARRKQRTRIRMLEAPSRANMPGRAAAKSRRASNITSRGFTGAPTRHACPAFRSRRRCILIPWASCRPVPAGLSHIS